MYCGALQEMALCACVHGQWFCASVWEHQVCVPQSTNTMPVIGAWLNELSWLSNEE